MNSYEKYLQDKLNDAESKIESLYYQISTLFGNNASLTVQNANLILENESLSEAVKLFSDEYTRRLILQDEISDLNERRIIYERQTIQLKESLSKCYNIAYDLMPSGHCPPKIMDYAEELRTIQAMLDSNEKKL